MSDSTQNKAGQRISYREDIKLFDCTIRDGGLMNDHKFEDKTVRAVYQACVDGGVDYMEIGYINSRRLFDPKDNGPWKFSGEEDVRRIVTDNDTDLKISVMSDAEKSDYKTDILPSDQSVIDMVRIATYIHQIPLALDMIQDAHDKGYETCLNLMAISTVPEDELDAALELLVQSPVGALYVVDSFGSLYSEQIQDYVDKFKGYIGASDKQIGVHMHNNRQLAFANTIEGLIRGANYLDASLAGLGRGAGNCQMELLLSFLHNPKFRLRPLLECIQDHIEPMREELMWGFDYPYMITGILNQHPRAGMAFNASDKRGRIVDFFDEIEADE
jgi:4-hydroxy 2-oxovalerate aldolase